MEAGAEVSYAAAAHDLFDLGIKPGGRTAAAQVRAEADGTWAALQGTAPGEPSKVEIKAMATSSSGKVRYAAVVDSGMAGTGW